MALEIEFCDSFSDGVDVYFDERVVTHAPGVVLSRRDCVEASWSDVRTTDRNVLPLRQGPPDAVMVVPVDMEVLNQGRPVCLVQLLKDVKIGYEDSTIVAIRFQHHYRSLGSVEAV